jgi:uncharacterized protein (DUF1800 family)
MERASYVATNRFGLGCRLGEAPPRDPRAWLRAQIEAPDKLAGTDLSGTAEALALVAAQEASDHAMRPTAPGAAADPAPRPRPVGDRLRQEIKDLLANALVTDAPFRERLVWFWANHFTIAARGLVPCACAGAYVREAIRPHVTGRFADMLLAVMRHPAMLAYLDQAQSIGPDSVAGEKRHTGLNENLARECLELHTVSPASGYTQADVTNFAKILTGWSVETKEVPLGFRFRPRTHEPGEIELMGQTWPEGEAGGVAALEFLGTHPATYRHLAQKLVCHFVADDPPPRDVHRIEAVLRDTQGDLRAASLAVIELPGAWIPGAKLRTPQEYVIACLRALGKQPEQVPNMGGQITGLGQPPFQAPFPIGWPDRAADWAGPEAMLRRAEFACAFAGGASDLDAAQVAASALGPLLHRDTAEQIASAASRRDALTLLLASPDFMRR